MTTRRRHGRKIRVAFVKYGGLVNTGGERTLMRLAMGLDKSRLQVTYFWCEPGKEVPHRSCLEFRDELESAGVRPVEFRVGFRDLRDPIKPWVRTDFFDVFRPGDFDIVQTLREGGPEYPFVFIPRPVVEFNIFGGVDTSVNTVRTVCNSPWLLRRWLANGGDPRKGTAVYIGVERPTAGDLRGELRIPAEALVVGLHQRPDDRIFSEIPLRASPI